MNRPARARSLSLLAFALAPLAAAAAPADYAVAVFAPPDGQPFAAPLDMDESGVVALYAGTDAWDPFARAYLLDPEVGFRRLAEPEPYYNFLFGLASTGHVVGRSGQRAWSWEQGAPVPLIPAPGFFSCTAYDVSPSGLIVGSVGDSDFFGPRPCSWSSSAASAQILFPPLSGGDNGTAMAVNSAGQIAGTAGQLVSFFHAVRWDDPAQPPLQIGPLPGAVNGQALDLNELGDVVGSCGYADNTVQAFLYVDSPPRLLPLGFLGSGGYSEARGLNTSRQVVGTSRVAQGVAHAFLWEGGTMHDLNELVVVAPANLELLTAATVVTDSGLIAAEALLRDGRRGVAILTPLP